MEFVKMHGLGNDFVMLDHFAGEPDIDYPATAQMLCNRQMGIGADGLVVILPSGLADARMRIFNPDGSEAEMCGNGIRCVARYVYENGLVRVNPLRIETLAGVLSLNLLLEKELVQAVRVDMGEPVLKPEQVPVLAGGEPVRDRSLQVGDQTFLFTAVSMGNPHCVIFMDDLESWDWHQAGARIEMHPAFPKKTNVEFVRLDGPNHITLKVWERGAGPTLACGTGACAATVAAVLNNKTARKLTVSLPGGDLLVEWGQDNHVYMTGPASYVFRGKLY